MERRDLDSVQCEGIPREVSLLEAGVVELLRSAGLPVVDLRTGKSTRVFVLGLGHRPQGVVGIELYGRVGLLRSLAVASRARRRGLGRMLVSFAEERARAAGVCRLYLLTTSARDFFLRMGYTEQRRDEAPEAIRMTAEYSSLCPQSAVLMSKAFC